MQSVSSRIWTHVAVSNSYGDNNYSTGQKLLTPSESWLLLQSSFTILLIKTSSLLDPIIKDQCQQGYKHRKQPIVHFIRKLIHTQCLVCLQRFPNFIHIGLVGRVFAKWSGRPGFNPRSHHTKNFKNGTWYLFA